MRTRPGGRSRWVLVGVLLLALAATSSLAGARTVKRTATVAMPGDFGASEPTATAVCPRGKRVVLGGLRLGALPPEGQAAITEFARSGRRGWTASAVNWALGAQFDTTLTSIAYCGRGPRGRIRPASESVTAQTVDDPGDPNAQVTATCPKGTRLLFGGYDQGPLTSGDMYAAGAYRVGPRGWRVEAINYGDPNTLTALAYCSARAPSVTTVSRQTTIPGGNNRVQIRALCPEGRRLLFGGFRAEASYHALATLTSLAKGGPRSWVVGAESVGTVDADLAGFAYCAKQRR